MHWDRTEACKWTFLVNTDESADYLAAGHYRGDTRSVRNNYIHEWAAEMRTRIQEEGITLSEYNKQSKVTVASAIKYRLQSMEDQEQSAIGADPEYFSEPKLISKPPLVWIVGWKLIKLIACGPFPACQYIASIKATTRGAELCSLLAAPPKIGHTARRRTN